ncbi:MAG: hypothetical protein ACTS4X_00395 [Candidatus Hodgkinia cicadicola]
MGTICEVNNEVYVKASDGVLYNRNVVLTHSLNGNVIDILEGLKICQR